MTIEKRFAGKEGLSIRMLRQSRLLMNTLVKEKDKFEISKFPEIIERITFLTQSRECKYKFKLFFIKMMQ